LNLLSQNYDYLSQSDSNQCRLMAALADFAADTAPLATKGSIVLYGIRSNMNKDLLGKCRTCGRQVSRRASECPDCREPRPSMTEEEFQKTWYDKLKGRFISIIFWLFGS